MDKIIEFKGYLKTERFSTDNYKICVIDVNRSIYDIPANYRGEIVLVGDMPELIFNTEYSITATSETNKNFGVQYKVVSIKIEKPATLEASRNFLYEVITKKQTDTLLKVYPNIIDMIIKNDIDEVDFNKLKGIKEKTFEKIKSKVIENFALIELVDFFKGFIPMNIIKKLYDNYSSIKIVKNNLKNNPYKCLCNLSRVGFKTADKTLLDIEKLTKKDKSIDFSFDEDLKTSKQRMRACIDFILDENELSGNTKLDIKELRRICGEYTPECINHFVSIIKDNKESIYVCNESKCISTLKARMVEEYIKLVLLKMLDYSTTWSINTELYRTSNKGISLTDEQMGVLDNVCKHNVSILTAPGGSGKSASVENLINLLEDNNKTYILCTPTGKSSEVLSEYTNRESKTIHRTLEYDPSLDNPWTFNAKNQLQTDIIIVDEFSMVDIYLFKHLLDAIDITRTKILFVFDSHQLPSVGAGNISQDLLSSKIIPTTILTKIFRYNEGGLMQVATQIRNGKSFLDSNFSGVKVFGEKKDFTFVELQQTKIMDQLIKLYSKLLSKGYDLDNIMVLSSQNKGDYGTKSINKTIQKFIQKNKDNNFLMRGEDKFYKGDKVIQIENNYKANLYIESSILENQDEEIESKTHIYNGNTGIVKMVNYNSLVVDFKGKLIEYKKEDLKQLELGYCISIHRSQGSASKQVICVTPKSHSFMLNSNLLYVAVTRSKEKAYMLGNIITVNRAVKKKENLKRDTWLKDLLIEKITQNN